MISIKWQEFFWFEVTIQSNFLYNKLNLQGLKSDEEAVWTNFFLQEYTETDIGKMNAKTNCKNYILTTRVKTKKERETVVCKTQMSN